MGSAKKNENGSNTDRRARLEPTQKRSRERFERILASAVEVMAEKGSEAFRMSDIVERTGVPFGSLYQYFPDKTAIIGTLAERYDLKARECVQSNLATVATAADLHPALCNIVDGYYRMYMDEPAMRDVWQATQADRALQRLDEEEGIYLAGVLTEALRALAPNLSEDSLSTFSQTIMILIAAAVRHAITLPPKEGLQVLTVFKRMLPTDLSLIHP